MAKPCQSCCPHDHVKMERVTMPANAEGAHDPPKAMKFTRKTCRDCGAWVGDAISVHH